MRLWNYVLTMLIFSVAVIAASLGALAVAFLMRGLDDPITLPPWTILPFIAVVVFPVSFHFFLRAKRVPFRIPVPDLEDPERTRASRQLKLILAGLILAAASGKGYFAYRFFTDPGAAENASPWVLLIPGFCLVFAVIPWVRLVIWLRKAEDGLIEKRKNEAAE